MSFESSGGSSTTVGSRKLPLSPMRWPPARIFAFRSAASSTKLVRAGMRRLCASGPIFVSASRPGPTFSVFTLSRKRATNRSYAFSCT